ncbi:hypothetical protein EBN03_20365 [Nocardia stercoris]|uniref:Uncharacterized protein n=2 Tax=Nocardia stercoris TaxID=2483361 RepID=A0A3M2L093_9NOCA|nr:hypothetical protein EBN03_20365 [Nocardia stercoris]
MWGLAAAAIAGPELAAVFRAGDWPTISSTVGHLADAHAWVRLIVVAVIVLLGYYAIPQLNALPPVTDRAVTPGGRTTRYGELVRAGGLGGYLVLAAAALIAAAVFAGAARHVHPGTYSGAYVLYGAVALLWVVVPSLLAYFWSRDVPFPTLFRTVAYLELRIPAAAAIVLTGLVILLLHLAFYPWPRMP